MWARSANAGKAEKISTSRRWQFVQCNSAAAVWNNITGKEVKYILVQLWSFATCQLMNWRETQLHYT